MALGSLPPSPSSHYSSVVVCPLHSHVAIITPLHITLMGQKQGKDVKPSAKPGDKKGPITKGGKTGAAVPTSMWLLLFVVHC